MNWADVRNAAGRPAFGRFTPWGLWTVAAVLAFLLRRKSHPEELLTTSALTAVAAAAVRALSRWLQRHDWSAAS